MDCLVLETITRTYSVTDSCGNSINVTQTISINDITPPTATNIADKLSNCIDLIPPVDINVVTDEADNCGTPTVAFVSDVSDGLSCPETITRTYSVTDSCGNSIILMTLRHSWYPAPAVDPSVVIDEADNCGTPTVAFVSESTDGNPCPETITRIYSVTDSCGNSINVTHY